MRYTVAIICALTGALPLIELEADNDPDAVDAGRALHDVPEEGGDYEVIVTALDSRPGIGPRGIIVQVPPGEISRFKVKHEPQPHVAAEVYAERARLEELALVTEKREKLKAEIRAEVIAEQAAALKKGVHS